ncbi:5-oxoprolinase subunit PxpB [Herpetosiphon giganteus]|uniref:5-oxoprolinase subunit PxpB n=1 Tax=Herpetosiphon giganteus TaxID=2029754 RepID=UPI001956DE93|nr:5-oxoprolinase subunit PxpB [Herpetosiphon giganteus]MBM7842212.1 KipI family sensor histidine kinase inhibitor [Herpetosiphon giganteus]
MLKIELFGDSALLITTAQPAQLALTLRNAQLFGVLDVVAGLETVTVVFNVAKTNARQVRRSIHRLQVTQQTLPTPTIHRIPIRYDGIDLAEVAERCQLTVNQVIELHASAEYRVAMVGFLPGFPYLDGLPAALHLPRRATPRAKVAAGSVAIANDQTGIYPQSSPGGWHILGTTPLHLFDSTASPPALLNAGDIVYFENMKDEG